MTLLCEHYALLCPILPLMFYFYFNDTLLYVLAQRSRRCILSGITDQFPGSKRGKATVSPTCGFDGRKRDKQKRVLHLLIQIGNQQPKSQTEDISCL